MEFLTALLFSLTFSGMALWVRGLYVQIERLQVTMRRIANENRRMAEQLKAAESTKLFRYVQSLRKVPVE